MSVLFDSTIGTFVVDLYVDTAPVNCCNFLKLCKFGYYSFCNFYSVEKDFVAKSGSGRQDCNGKGPSLFTNEIIFGTRNQSFKESSLEELHNSHSHSKKGTISLIEGGKARFFITLADNLINLDSNHTIIGFIAEGIEIVDRLNALLVDSALRPFEDAVIKGVYVLHDPFPDANGFNKIQPLSPFPSIEVIKPLRIGWLKDVGKEDSKEAKRRQEQAESESKALTLELLGDLPDFALAPPDNVLFVCRLNYLTRQEDLKTVFSRFGSVKSCKIICDKQSQKSLGYGFVEFETKESCDLAYSKMQNAIIDDRRIHVDFSQSIRR